MQPPCFLLKRYLEVNPAFYRTSPLSFLVTPPVTFLHWFHALAAPFDASCRFNHTTPPVVLQPLSDAASWCLPLSLPMPPPGVFPCLSVRTASWCYYSHPFRAASWRHGSLETASLSHQPSPNPVSPDPARAQRLSSAPLSSDSIRTTLVRAKLLQSISSSVAVTTPDDRQ